MSTWQKIVKYIAIALGAFIIINIITGIATGIILVVGLITGFSHTNNTVNHIEQEVQLSQNLRNIQSIDIDLNLSKLDIRIGEEFKIIANNISDDFYSIKNNKLIIKDKKQKNYLFNATQNISEIIIYIPENKIFKTIEIETGIGQTTINGLKAETIDLDLGVGKVIIENMKSTNNTKISGGAGEITIKNIDLNNLKLDGGIGKFSIQGKITGNNHIEGGIGQIIIDLNGQYKIQPEVGIGTVYINDQKANNNTEYGNGNNIVKIEGGIGQINVNINNDSLQNEIGI